MKADFTKTIFITLFVSFQALAKDTSSSGNTHLRASTFQSSTLSLANGSESTLRKYDLDPLELGASQNNQVPFAKLTPEISAKIAQLRKDAVAGNLIAMFEMGVVSFEGAYAPQDYDQALEWFRKAAQQKHAGAMVYLSNFYRIGYLEDKDLKKTAELLQEAAQLGHPDAMYLFGCLHTIHPTFSRLSNRNQKVLNWFQLAAKSDHAEAMTALGLALIYGTFDNKNIIEGSRWLKTAALAGFRNGMYHYGSLCLSHRIPDCSQNEGMSWLKQAAENGSEAAKNELNKLGN